MWEEQSRKLLEVEQMCAGLQGWAGLSEARAAGTEPKGKELEVSKIKGAETVAQNLTSFHLETGQQRGSEQ